MRVIKFRGKRPDGSWNYGRSIRFKQNGEVYIQAASVDSQTVGQFTGLFDKNGKEIYEGDLLGSKGKIVGFVKGGVRGYCYDVVYIKHPTRESDWPLYSTVKYDYPEQIEVIGNIYDNPELLEGGMR